MGSHADLDYRLTVRFESAGHAHRLVLGAQDPRCRGADGQPARWRADSGARGGVATHLRTNGRRPGRGEAIVAGVLEIEDLRAEGESRTPGSRGWGMGAHRPPTTAGTGHRLLVSEHHGEGSVGVRGRAQRVQIHFELAEPARRPGVRRRSSPQDPAMTSTKQRPSSTSSPTTKRRPGSSAKNAAAAPRPTPSSSTRAKAAPSSSRRPRQSSAVIGGGNAPSRPCSTDMSSVPLLLIAVHVERTMGPFVTSPQPSSDVYREITGSCVAQ